MYVIDYWTSHLAYTAWGSDTTWWIQRFGTRGHSPLDFAKITYEILVLCFNRLTLTISLRGTSPALVISYQCPDASEASVADMGKIDYIDPIKADNITWQCKPKYWYGMKCTVYERFKLYIEHILESHTLQYKVQWRNLTFYFKGNILWLWAAKVFVLNIPGQYIEYGKTTLNVLKHLTTICYWLGILIVKF